MSRKRRTDYRRSGRIHCHPCGRGKRSRHRHGIPSCSSPIQVGETASPPVQRIYHNVSDETGPDVLDPPNTDGPAQMSATRVEQRRERARAPLGTFVHDLDLVVIDPARRRDGVIRACCARLAVAYTRGSCECKLSSVQRHAQRGQAILLTPSCGEHQHRVRADHRHCTYSGWGRGGDAELVVVAVSRREIAAEVRIGNHWRRRTCCRSRIVPDVRRRPCARDMCGVTRLRVQHVAERGIFEVRRPWKAMGGCVGGMRGSGRTVCRDTRAKRCLRAHTGAQPSRTNGRGRRGIRRVACLITRWVWGGRRADDPGLEDRRRGRVCWTRRASPRGGGDRGCVARRNGASRWGNGAG